MIVYYGSSQGVKYLVFMILMSILCYSDIYFLKKLKDTDTDKNDLYNRENVLEPLQLFTIFLILMEIVYKWKLSSILTSFSAGKSYLLNWLMLFIFTIPIFMTYNMNIKYSKYLIPYHYVNLLIKILIVLIAVLPKTKNKEFIKFMKSGYMNLNNFKFSQEKC